MPIGLRQHAGNHLRLPHLLRGRHHQRQSLQGGVDEHWHELLQEEGSSWNPVINMGPTLKPFLGLLVLDLSFTAPDFSGESSRFKEHLLYYEEVVEHDDDFNIFRQYFEACITASYLREMDRYC